MQKFLILTSLLAVGALAGVAKRPLFYPKLDWRIIGGREAPEGAFPYQVSLRYRDSHSCGGVIIHHEWIVTAASCVQGIPEVFFSVVVGTNQLSNGGTKYAVLAAYPHEKYDQNTRQNNVAILRVQSINFTPKVSSIALDREDVGENEVCTFTGWGFTSSPGSNAARLQYIFLKTISNKICAAANEEQAPITANQICTFTRSGEGSCSGDTGGPLVRIVGGTPKLVGIANWMVYPCASGKPDVHSRASSYYDWFRIKCNNCI